MSLMVSISGVRGVIGESLTPEVVVSYASAFGRYCKERFTDTPEVIIGRDGRITGKILTHLISSTLLSTGVNVRALGICPTPTVALAVERNGAAGGIAITASHNPMEWNGLKFFAPTGMFLDSEENKDLWAIVQSGRGMYASWDSLGQYTADDTWTRRHVESVWALPYIDRDRVRQRRYKVVVDCVNASGGAIVPELLHDMGCDVIQMNCDLSGVFAHTPEPLPENLSDLAERVTATHADLGIAVDPDADRLVFITEKGEPFGEEYTLASVVKFILEREHKNGTQPLRVATNLSTTRAIDDIAAFYGAEVVRTPVGEIHVAKRMKEIGAVIGGEGNGGVILPTLHLGRDAMVGVALFLQQLAEFGGLVSEFKATLPQYAIAKGKIALGDTPPDETLARIRESVGLTGTVKVNDEDGLKLDFPDHWVHLRKSNTEPIIRVIAEAATMNQAVRMVEAWKEKIASLSSEGSRGRGGMRKPSERNDP
jgi:phosphomannomutase